MEAARRLINAAADAVFSLPDGWLLPHDTLDEHVVRAVRLRQARAEFEDAPIKCLRQRLVRHHNMMSLRVASLAGDSDVRWGYYQIMTTELGRPEPAPTTCGFPGCCERRGLRKVGATGQELPVVHLCDARCIGRVWNATYARSSRACRWRRRIFARRRSDLSPAGNSKSRRARCAAPHARSARIRRRPSFAHTTRTRSSRRRGACRSAASARRGTTR